MKKNNYIMKNILKFLLIFLGFALLTYYFWFRFIRERLPRDIPFELTSISFFILVGICVIYLYIILKIIYKINNNSSILNLFKKKIAIILLPIKIFNDFLLFDLKLSIVLIKIFYYLIKYFNLYDDKKNYNMFIMMDLTPKLILVCIFFYDIFYLKTINNFYYYIIISIIPLIYTYIIYNFSTITEHLQTYLEKNCYIKINEPENEDDLDYFISLNSIKANAKGLTNLRYFIKIQVASLIFENDLYNYSIVETIEARYYYANKNNIKLPVVFEMQPDFDFISKDLAKKFREKIEIIIYLQAFVEVYNDITKPQIINKQLIIILSSYLIGWLYILIISIHTLNYLEIINIIETMQNHIEPFSELKLK